jgi:hypothetical protein
MPSIALFSVYSPMKTLRLLRNTSNISHVPIYAHLRSPPVAPAVLRQMTMKASLPHEERTAAEPRQNRLYSVRLSHIEQVNPTVRLLQLAIPPPASEGNWDDSRGDEQVRAPILCETDGLCDSILTRLIVRPRRALYIPPRPMARRAHSLRLQSGRVQHHLDPRRRAGPALARTDRSTGHRGARARRGRDSWQAAVRRARGAGGAVESRRRMALEAAGRDPGQGTEHPSRGELCLAAAVGD